MRNAFALRDLKRRSRLRVRRAMTIPSAFGEARKFANQTTFKVGQISAASMDIVGVDQAT